MQQNSKSECSKLAQKNIRLGMTGQGRKVIHLELNKKFKFDHTNKWYTHNPESIQENDISRLDAQKMRRTKILRYKRII